MTGPDAIDPWVPQPMTVLDVRADTHDTVTMRLDPGGEFPFLPGQFTMLYRFGVGEVPISISGDPAERGVLVHTIRGVGGVTKPLLTTKAGDVLGVRGPFGTAWPMYEARGSDIVFVAGGIGLAPLRPAILHVLKHRADYGRVILLYGARAPSEMLYTDELHRWRGRFDIDVEVTVDRAEPGWLGPVGVVTRLIERATFDPTDTVVFTCGPEIMMRFVIRELQQRGLSDDRIWVTLERNMKCAIGLCGHCQLGGAFLCRDGAVFRYDRVARDLAIKEL